MQDLIIVQYELSTNRRGKSLSLERLQYVSGEKNGDKCYMHYAVLVKDHARNENITLQVTLGVSDNGDQECWDQ